MSYQTFCKIIYKNKFNMNWKVNVDKMIYVSVLTIASTIVFSYVCQGKDARSLVEFWAKIYPFKLKKNGAVKFEDVATEKNRSVLKAKIALLIKAQHCSAKNERAIVTIRAKAVTFTSTTEPSKPVNLRIFFNNHLYTYYYNILWNHYDLGVDSWVLAALHLRPLPA